MAAHVHRVGELYVQAEGLEGKCFLDMTSGELSAYCHYPIFSALKVTRSDDHPLFEVLISHREYVGGCGFLNRMSGADIPLVSRILCVTTEYEELMLRRGHSETERGVIQGFIVKNLAGRYDDDVVTALMVTLAAESIRH